VLLPAGLLEGLRHWVLLMMERSPLARAQQSASFAVSISGFVLQDKE
jgi:hypothetical protein